MPNIASAKKRMRQDIKRNARNRAYVSRIRTLSKKTEQMCSNYNGNQEELVTLLRNTQKIIDRAGAKGILKKNTMARKNARLNLLCKHAVQKTEVQESSKK